MEWSLLAHRTICHSKGLSVEQCEYNLLNKTTTSVRQIHPENSYQENMNISNNRSQEDDRYEDRYHLDRRDDSRHDDNRRIDNDHGRDEYRCNDCYDLRPDEDRQNDYRRDGRNNYD